MDDNPTTNEQQNPAKDDDSYDEEDQIPLSKLVDDTSSQKNNKEEVEDSRKNGDNDPKDETNNAKDSDTPSSTYQNDAGDDNPSKSETSVAKEEANTKEPEEKLTEDPGDKGTDDTEKESEPKAKATSDTEKSNDPNETIESETADDNDTSSQVGGDATAKADVVETVEDNDTTEPMAVDDQAAPEKETEAAEPTQHEATEKSETVASQDIASTAEVETKTPIDNTTPATETTKDQVLEDVPPLEGPPPNDTIKYESSSDMQIDLPKAIMVSTENDIRRERPKVDTSPKDSAAMNLDVEEVVQEAKATVDAVMDVDLPTRPLPKKPANIILSCQDNDDENIFAAFKNELHKKGGKKSKVKPLLVKITSVVPQDTIEEEKKDEAGDTIADRVSVFRSDILHWSVEEQVAQAEAELEDSLAFFQESHEDQDPAFTALIKSQKRKQIETELKALELEDQAGRREIESVVNSQMKNKQNSTDEQYERYKTKKAGEEKQAMVKLQKLFNDKVASNQSKINQGIQVLKKRHSTEGQRFLAQHRQQVAQRNLPEHLASQEWANLQQQLSNKHKRQVQEFMGKGEEVKKRTEADYRREVAKIRSQYEKQISDVESNRRAIYQKIFSGYQQIRQRYLKRHLQKIKKKRDALNIALAEINDSPQLEDEGETKKERAKDVTKSSKEDKMALRLPSPIKSSGEGLDVFPYKKAGAASRHKHRKGVLSQISKQLSVEIHNEGVWVAVLKENKDEKKKEPSKDPHTESEQKLFLPWGVKAGDFLEAIICGEIPSVLDSGEFDFGETVAMNGGHLRCVMTDLRTSEVTAQMQRVQAAGEQPNVEAAALEQKARELQAAYSKAESIHAKFEKEEKDITPTVKEAIKDYESKKLHWENFRSKFAKFLGPDGNPVPQTNPSDRQKLTQAITKYRGNVENAEKRAKLAQMKLRQLKEGAQKYLNLKKQTQRAAAMAAASAKKRTSMASSGRSYIQAKDAHSALELTADKRREQLNHKRTNSTSSTWVQNLPGVPGPLRRSLWHKMHRRRQPIVLRPSLDRITDGLKSAVLKRQFMGTQLDESDKILQLEEAEQKFLVSLHPMAPRDKSISSIPSTSTPWGEPGWHVILDVPKPASGQLLPRAPGAPIVEKLLSEINSAPGRQAASMIRGTQIRSLEGPLSTISTVTSLAETNPGVAVPTRSGRENDPMNPTSKQFKDGYAFNPKLIIPTKPIVSIRRKTPTSKESTTSSISGSAASAKKPASKSSSQSASATAASSSSVSRKRKSVGDSASSKPTQRRKPAAKPTAAQVKALHVQQQKQRQAAAAAAAAQRQQQQQKQRQQQQAKQLAQQRRQQQQQQQQQQQIQPQSQPNQQQQQMVPNTQYQRQQAMNSMDRSQNSYSNHGQFMQPMPAPPNQVPAQNYQQQLYQQQQQAAQQRQVPQQQQFQSQQMAQLRMMQQQQASQGVSFNQGGHGMQSIPQFFQPMQQQFSPTPIGMPGQVVGQAGMPMNLQGNSNNMQQSQPNGDDSNDPLFMLK